MKLAPITALSLIIMVMIVPILPSSYRVAEETKAKVFETNAARNAISSDDSSQPTAPDRLVIEGLVQTPLNITYTELRTFPQVSEVATLYCVGPILNVTYNWTGVPLFYLLSLARVVPGGYREVVFNATDGLSNSILLETAMDPTSILALEANGTDLEKLDGFGNGSRVTFPCKWGYKWVRWVSHITVIDYVYRGKYDPADTSPRLNCTKPQTEPPTRAFSIMKLGNYTVEALSNSTIESTSYDLDTKLILNMSGPENSRGYCLVTFERTLLNGPYDAYVNNELSDSSITYLDNKVYVFVDYAHDTSTAIVEIHSLISLDTGQFGIATGGSLANPISIDR